VSTPLLNIINIHPQLFLLLSRL